MQGRVALVTGASRGIGKGIAVALGREGATVYITGRTLQAEEASVPLGGSLIETANLVTEAGGMGVALQCDHRDDAQVQAVFAQVRADHGRLDLLVNNAWGGYQGMQRGESGFGTKFWKHADPGAFWDSMVDVGVRSHYVASAHAAELMSAQGSGLIVHLSSKAAEGYSSNVVYGVSKAAVDRMAADMAHELRKLGVAVVSLWPGRVTTEMILSRKGSTKDNESPEFVGRSVVALACAPDLLEKSGGALHTRQLAREYGFTDVDGRVPSLTKGL